MDKNLEQDLWQSNEFLHKIRTRDDYAQNVYAALCNMRWQPAEVWPVLKDEYWSCSWRAAGGIVADFIGKGDYMDWYCSGMGGLATYDVKEGEDYMAKMQYVSEGTVTDEIREDFARLGWSPSPWPEDSK
jgi:hypothetical protein